MLLSESEVIKTGREPVSVNHEEDPGVFFIISGLQSPSMAAKSTE